MEKMILQTVDVFPSRTRCGLSSDFTVVALEIPSEHERTWAILVCMLQSYIQSITPRMEKLLVL